MNLHLIPRELKELPHWVVASGAELPNGKRSKVPLNPRTLRNASSDDPTTWGTFEEAMGTGFPILGFQISREDPFTVIDLDEPVTDEEKHVATSIIEMFKGTYAEVSLSGKGVHIICLDRHKTQRTPRRRGKVELYPHSQYIIQTGEWLEGSASIITDCTELLDELYAKMPAAVTAPCDLEQIDSGIPDEKILEMIRKGGDVDKFNRLWRGDIKGVPEWPTPSDADFALMGKLVHFTHDNAQCRRLFRSTPLGQRDKHQGTDRLIDLMLSKLRAKQPPRLDLTDLLGRMEVRTQDRPAEVVPGPFIFPPGMVGRNADYIFRSAVRPVPEIALAASLSLMAGMAGRAYNISATGLNLYLLLIARTGTGKEGAASGIDALINSVRTQIPAIVDFMGPASFASGQALTKFLAKKPCFISPMGEIGLLLKEMCSPNASANMLMLRRALLDCYGKSGHNKILQPSVYANSDNDVPAIFSPSVSIMGDTTPETIFESWSPAVLAEGFVSRWQTIEHQGGRPPLNPNRGQEVDEDTMHGLIELAKFVLTEKERPAWINVDESPDARKLFDSFEQEATDHINSSLRDTSCQIWNRAHLKALKLGALVAVGCDFKSPTVQAEHAQWAINMVRDDVTRMHTRFVTGDIGLGDTKREADLIRAMKDWHALSNESKRSYKVPEKLFNCGLVPWNYLLKRCRGLSSFQSHRLGSTKAFDETVQNLVTQDVLTVPMQVDLLREFDTQARMVGEGENFSH